MGGCRGHLKKRGILNNPKKAFLRHQRCLIKVVHLNSPGFSQHPVLHVVLLSVGLCTYVFLHTKDFLPFPLYFRTPLWPLTFSFLLLFLLVSFRSVVVVRVSCSYCNSCYKILVVMAGRVVESYDVSQLSNLLVRISEGDTKSRLVTFPDLIKALNDISGGSSGSTCDDNKHTSTSDDTTTTTDTPDYDFGTILSTLTTTLNDNNSNVVTQSLQCIQITSVLMSRTKNTPDPVRQHNNHNNHNNNNNNNNNEKHNKGKHTIQYNTNTYPCTHLSHTKTY